MTVLSPVGVTLDGPISQLGRIDPDDHLHVKESCLRRWLRWRRVWCNISNKCSNRCNKCKIGCHIRYQTFCYFIVSQVRLTEKLMNNLFADVRRCRNSVRHAAFSTTPYHHTSGVWTIIGPLHCSGRWITGTILY